MPQRASGLALRVWLPHNTAVCESSVKYATCKSGKYSSPDSPGLALWSLLSFPLLASVFSSHSPIFPSCLSSSCSPCCSPASSLFTVQWIKPRNYALLSQHPTIQCHQTLNSLTAQFLYYILQNYWSSQSMTMPYLLPPQSFNNCVPFI